MSAAQDDDTRDGVWEPRFAPVAQIIPPNVFADMDVKVAAAVASGADVIDLAKGNPDAYPAEFIRDVAKSSVDDPLNARYTPFDGKPAFLQAAANWYRNVHGVELDWRSQLFAVEGAVDGLAGLFAILIDRGDAVAFADPYYPSYHCMSVMHGAEEILLPARAEPRLATRPGRGGRIGVAPAAHADTQLSEQPHGRAGAGVILRARGGARQAVRLPHRA